MEWLNIHISTLRSPEFIGSDPTERATWLCVLGYSVEQENGGRMTGAALWKDRQWQQACGVTLREVRGAYRLLKADGDDILVNGYPTAKEKQVRQARSVALAGAMARWGNADRHAETMPVGMPDGNAEGKGREQEGKGTGRERHPAPIEPTIDPQEQDLFTGIDKPAAPKPFKPKLGLMELRTIPHINTKFSDDHATWLDCLNDVGVEVLARAAKELKLAGAQLYASVVTSRAYEIQSEIAEASKPKPVPWPDDLTTVTPDHPDFHLIKSHLEMLKKL
jgi:hypothetical protein